MNTPNGNGYLNGTDDSSATLIDPQVGRVRLLESEFRKLEEIHAKAARTLQNEALQWENEIRSQTWRVASKAIKKALKPSFPGAPPAQLASALEKMLELQDEAVAGALQAAPMPTIDDVLDTEDARGVAPLPRGELEGLEEE